MPSGAGGGGSYDVEGERKRKKSFLAGLHTCAPKSGDLEFLVGKFMSCIGRFSCCKFQTFFTEVKVAKSSDIARNMLQSITMSTYANRSENMRPFTV